MAYSIEDRIIRCQICGAITYRYATEETYYDPSGGRITERNPIPEEVIEHTAADCRHEQRRNRDGGPRRR
jgi:hypothetical protein